MCLVALAFHHHPNYPLVVVANRDEFYDRPASSARFWEDKPSVLAGRDLEAGGTWFGVNHYGHWATVTNYRGGGAGGKMRSRGNLPTDFLAQPDTSHTKPGLSPGAYAKTLLEEGHHFQGFSLLVGTLDELVYCSNSSIDSTGGLQHLNPGVYTLSNDVLDTPWPKAEYARQMLTAVLDQPGMLEVDSLLAVLGSQEQFPDHQLPDTGVGLEMERTLSPPFIVAESYGTRCTTVLMIDAKGRATFAEQSYHHGRATERKDYSFTLLDS